MSRESILDAVRSNLPQPVGLTDINTFQLPDCDLLELFQNRLAAGGGDSYLLENKSEIAQTIEKAFPNPKLIISGFECKGLSAKHLDTIESVHDLNKVDLAVIEGAFGVAENGAIWIDDQYLKHRAICFITQHLVLVLNKTQIIDTMNTAYRRLEVQKPGFGCFIAGPSKTADIEQSLVIGAHGARSTIVLLV